MEEFGPKVRTQVKTGNGLYSKRTCSLHAYTRPQPQQLAERAHAPSRPLPSAAHRVAGGRVVGLCVRHDRARLSHVRLCVDVDVADAVGVAQHGDLGVGLGSAGGEGAWEGGTEACDNVPTLPRRCRCPRNVSKGALLLKGAPPPLPPAPPRECDRAPMQQPRGGRPLCTAAAPTHFPHPTRCRRRTWMWLTSSLLPRGMTRSMTSCSFSRSLISSRVVTSEIRSAPSGPIASTITCDQPGRMH